MNSELTTAQRDSLLLTWQQAQQALAYAKEQEMRLRKDVVEQLFGEGGEEGTETYDLPNGYEVKCAKKLNYKLAPQDETEVALDKLDPATASRLVKWEPKLSVKEYRELTKDERKIIDKVLTITAGTPQLELIEPKAPKTAVAQVVDANAWKGR